MEKELQEKLNSYSYEEQKEALVKILYNQFFFKDMKEYSVFIQRKIKNDLERLVIWNIEELLEGNVEEVLKELA